jgi:hypothetical protein
MSSQEIAARLTARVALIANTPNIDVDDTMFQTLRSLVTDPAQEKAMRMLAWQALVITAQGDRRRLRMVDNLKRRQQRQRRAA